MYLLGIPLATMAWTITQTILSRLFKADHCLILKDDIYAHNIVIHCVIDQVHVQLQFKLQCKYNILYVYC